MNLVELATAWQNALEMDCMRLSAEQILCNGDQRQTTSTVSSGEKELDALWGDKVCGAFWSREVLPRCTTVHGEWRTVHHYSSVIWDKYDPALML